MQQKGDGIMCNVLIQPGELAINCPLKLDIPMKKWFVKTGKVIERKENHCQETSKVNEDLQDEQ